MRGSKRKKRKGRFGVGAGLRGQVLDRPLILRGFLLGFLVNSETGHSEVLWALLLTVKQDTVKTSNQIFLLLFLLQKAMPFFL
jgi:hypothetical protein